MARHLKGHEIVEDDRQEILHSLRLRKERTSKTNTTNKDGRKGRKCLLEGCEGQKTYVRLDHHLQQIHGLTQKDPLYRTFINVNTRIMPVNGEKLEPQERCSKYAMKITKFPGGLYYMWLKDFNGGEHSDYNARQKCYQMRAVITGMGLNDIRQFGSKDSQMNLQSYMQQFKATHKGSSCITYLNTVIHFMKYLRSTLERCYCENFETILSNFDGWRHSFRKTSNMEKDYKHSDTLTVEDVKLLENSEPYHKARELLKTAKEGMVFKAHEKHLVRNYLIVKGFVRNSNRPCIIKNMTKAEFENSETVEDDQLGSHKVVYVADHKGVPEHGRGGFVMTLETYDEMKTYIQFFRPQASKMSNISKILRTKRKTYLSSDDVIKGLQSFFKIADLNSKVTSSAFRRLATTIVHEYGDAQQKYATAGHLLHRPSTAEASYRNYKKGKTTVAASNLVYNAMRNNVLSSEVLNPKNYPSKGNRTFTKEESQIICAAFDTYIIRKKPPSSNDIRAMLKQNEELAKVVKDGNYRIAQLKGCINNAINKEISKFNKDVKRKKSFVG